MSPARMLKGIVKRVLPTPATTQQQTQLNQTASATLARRALQSCAGVSSVSDCITSHIRVHDVTACELQWAMMQQDHLETFNAGLQTQGQDPLLYHGNTQAHRHADRHFPSYTQLHCGPMCCPESLFACDTVYLLRTAR